MIPGLGIGLLAVSLWRLSRALAIVAARLLLATLGAAVWAVSAVLLGAAWLLDNAPRRRPPPVNVDTSQGPTLAELLAPYGRQETTS